jgi:hypothetical protein
VTLILNEGGDVNIFRRSRQGDLDGQFIARRVGWGDRGSEPSTHFLATLRTDGGDNPAIGGLLSTVTQPVTLKAVQRCVNLSNVQGPGMICAPIELVFDLIPVTRLLSQ